MQTEGGKGGAMTGVSLGSKVTMDGDCSHEARRPSLLGKKKQTMTDPDSALKSRDITLPTKACTVKTMIFPVVISGCES